MSERLSIPRDRDECWALDRSCEDVLALAKAVEALERGRRFERFFQETLGAHPTPAQWEILESLQSAFIDAYVPALAHFDLGGDA